MALRTFGWALLVCAAWVPPSLAADLVPVKSAPAKAEDRPEVEIDVSLMSDYIYRGVSLTERRPSGATNVEAHWHGFYASANLQNVALPTNPVAEVTLTGGYKWIRDDFTLDLNATYFWYPGETLSEGMVAASYAEYAASVEREFKQLPLPITLKGTVAYAPDVSGTQAWGAYAEAGIEIELGELLRNVKWQFNATGGYWRFGNISPMLGGFPLPSYANWRLGFEFDFTDYLTLDVSYWDTNLSKEDCFVFTGDTMATPGGIPNPISNPDGLRSRLCGAALVGTVTWNFDFSSLKK